MSRKSFSIKEKIELVKEFDQSSLSQKDFAASKNISASTFRTILKRKDEFISTHEGTKRKKIRSAKYEELEVILKKWINDARRLNMTISGPILQERARQVANSLGISNFTASAGWLDRFKNRHSINYKQICDKSSSMNPDLTTDWNQYIFNLISGYEPSEIYNADEFGLFFKLMPNEFMILKHEKCQGGKYSKERLTVLVCTNMTGTDKKKLLIIGKYSKPHCLKNVKSLPCIYSSQVDAWMTADRFIQYLHEWDTELENRKILLLIDSCAAHPKEENLNNIKLIYLPSELQPLNQGIIKVLKQGYRRRIVQYYLSMMDSSTSPKISVLDAIHFLYAGWMEINQGVILNCFKKAGFGNIKGQQEVEEINDDNWTDLLMKQIFPEIKGFDDFDNGLATNKILTIETLINKNKSTSNERESEEEDESSIVIKPKIVNVLDALKTIRTFLVCNIDVEDKNFENINQLENFVLKKAHFEAYKNKK